jgi:small subunit ribosomal protein S4
MARYSGPKHRLQRRIGEDLNLKTNSLKVAKRLLVRPGQHGAKGRRRVSNYGEQLKEKQKVKYLYGVLEKKLQAYYKEASKNPVATGTALLSFLERRLDNIVYRLGMAPTRAAARQIVAHGHVQVNNKKVNVPSYRVKVKDVIALDSTASKIPVVADLLKEEGGNLVWLERKGAIGKVTKLPEREDTVEKIDEQLIVEYYSR